MNSSTAIKRALPLLVVIVIIIAIAVSCSVFSNKKPIPKIPNEDEIYLSLTEEGRTYQLDNITMYDLLKKNAGYSTLIDAIDKDILSGKVDSNDKNYWELVTDEEILEALEKAIFPDGKDNLSEEEQTKAEKTYYEDMYTGYGLKTKEEVENFHRLTIAKKLFATDRLKEAIQTADEAAADNDKLEPYFTEDDYETYYKANYEKKYGFWTIIVPFTTKDGAVTALKQLGYEIQTKDPNTSSDFDKWVKTVDGEKIPLTPAEVIQAFIDMYNTVYSYRVNGYPENTLTLIADKQYTIVEMEDYTAFEFNMIKSEDDEELNKLYFSYDDISNYQAEIQRYLSATMKTYTTEIDAVAKDQTWFTVNSRSYNNNTLHCYILKIAEDEIPELDDVKEEIYNKLFEEELTEKYIATEMVKLRNRKKLVIFDASIEAEYISFASSYSETIKPTKEKSSTLIAKIGTEEYSAEKLFELMDKRYGISLSLNEINRLRLLNNPEFNNIFDHYATDLKTSKRILNVQKWKSIKERSIREKQQFIGGVYAQYGYGPQYGWKNFIRDIYGVNSDEELLYHFLYSQVLTDYSSSLGDISELTEESELWQLIEENMQKSADEYFNVTGIHLLIKVEDNDGNPIDPEQWTATQKQYAEELYQQVWVYYREETGTAQEKFEAIAEAFNTSPRFLAKLDQNEAAQPKLDDVEYTFKNIEVSKFKTAGLSVKFENLGNFTNGKMVKPFEEAVRSIWKANPTSQSYIPYGATPNEETDEWDYLITEFGYHAYVNTSCTDIEKWDEENGYVIPTFAMIQTQLEDSSSEYILDESGEPTDQEFTAEMKKAITTYFNPIKTELTGNDYTSIQLYNQMKEEGFGIILENTNYTKEDFVNFLEFRINKISSKLAYFGSEEE